MGASNIVVALSSPGARLRVKVLRTPWARARGYLFRPRPQPGEGLLFLYSRPQRRAVHMMGVPFPLKVLWLDEGGTVVSVQSLRPWTGFAVSPIPVSAFLETHPDCPLSVGDHLTWEDAS